MLRVQKIECKGHCNLGQSVLCNTVTPFMQHRNTKSTHSWMVLASGRNSDFYWRGDTGNQCYTSTPTRVVVTLI